MKMKKFLVLFSMLAVMFSLSGCDEEAEKPFKYNDTDIVMDTMMEFQTYTGVSDEYKDYYINSGTAYEQSAIKGINQAANNDKVGEFQDYSNYIAMGNEFNMNLVDASITYDDEYVSVTIINKADNRDVEVMVKYIENPEYYMMYDKLSKEITADAMIEQMAMMGYTVDDFLALTGFDSIEEIVDNEINYYLSNQGLSPYIPEEMVVTAVYSNSELMGQAGMNTLIGMGTVFVVLIFISFIISLFKYLPALFAKKTKMPEPKKEEAKPAPVATTAATENLMNDAELVAVITAAIYAASGSTAGSGAVSKDTLVVRSIRRAKK